MPYPSRSVLDPLFARLRLHTSLDAADIAAFDRLALRTSTIGAGEQIVRHGSRASQCYVILSGHAFCHKIAPNGTRQITSFCTAGDLLGLEQAMLGFTDHGVRAMSVVQTAAFTAQALADLLTSRPTVALALIRQSLVETENMRDWLLTAARRPARARVAHLLCEIAHRESAGRPTDGHTLVCRVTQEQMGDALGLTAVHVNRIIGTLRSADLIRIDNRRITIPDWAALQQAGEFRPSDRQPREPEPAAAPPPPLRSALTA